MQRPTATINVRKNAYQALADFATNVISEMTAAIATFATPVPSLATLTTQKDALVAAIAAWGPVHNRGSHADLVNLRAQATTMYNLLISEMAYVQSIASTTAGTDYPLMASLILSSGFSVKNNPNPQGALAQPENFHQDIRPIISLSTPTMRWKKPLGLTSPGNVHVYEIFRSETDNISTATVIGTSTRCTFTDTTASPATLYFYWCRAVNNVGAGTSTASLACGTPAV
jgi:hypothetical protein